MKKKFNKFCMDYALFFLMFVALCACSSDSDDSAEVFEDPEGTYVIEAKADGNTAYRICTSAFNLTSGYLLTKDIRYSDILYFAKVGKVSGLGAINSRPETESSQYKIITLSSVMPGEGYIVQCIGIDGKYNSRTNKTTYTYTYARLYVDSYLLDEKDNKIGLKIKVQNNWQREQVTK